MVGNHVPPKRSPAAGLSYGEKGSSTVKMTESFIQDFLLIGKAVDEDIETHRHIVKGPLPDVHDVKYYHMDAPNTSALPRVLMLTILSINCRTLAPGSFRLLTVMLNSREKQYGRLFASTTLCVAEGVSEAYPIIGTPLESEYRTE
jgi:hypothetical protein